MVDNTRILTNESGYATNVFADKEKQMIQVCEYLEKVGFLPKELVRNEVQWFYRYNRLAYYILCLLITDYYIAI